MQTLLGHSTGGNAPPGPYAQAPIGGRARGHGSAGMETRTRCVCECRQE